MSYRLLPTALAYSLFVVFGIFCALFSIARPLCCFDDASFASISKNLANGLGYTFNLDYWDGPFHPHSFDALLGEGPASIIPVALAIYLIGSLPWVPGVTHVAMNTSLLLFLVTLLKQNIDSWGASRFAFCFVLAVMSVSYEHFAHWYAQLGETLAFLFIIVASAIWVTLENRIVSAALTGLFLGFSVLTKELAGLYVAVFTAMAIGFRLYALRNRLLNRKDMAIAVLFVGTGTIPYICFELWKLTSLGLSSFVSNWAHKLVFIKAQSTHIYNRWDLIGLVVKRSAIYENNFGITVQLSLAIAALASGLLVFRGSSKLIRLSLTLMVVYCVCLAHWLTVSNGWPRYFYIGLMIWCVLIALPMSMRFDKIVAAYFLCISIIFMGGMHKFKDRVIGLVDSWSPTHIDAVQSAQLVAQRLSKEALNEQVFTPWWAHVATLDYLMPKNDVFQRLDETDMDRIDKSNFIFLVNLSLESLDSLWWRRLVENYCAPPFVDIYPYKVYRCTVAN